MLPELAYLFLEEFIVIPGKFIDPGECLLGFVGHLIFLCSLPVGASCGRLFSLNHRVDFRLVADEQGGSMSAS